MCSSRTTRSPGARRGFVLATTLLVTTLLTVMLAAAFLLVSAEQRMTDNSFGGARALALAQAGLQNYFSQNRGITAGQFYDSTRIALSGGYADVVARQMRAGGASTGSVLALWLVRASGVATAPVMAGQVQGTHTIAQFAELNPGTLPARAAMVALNGIAKITGSGVNPLSGLNFNAAVPGCTPPPLADTFAVAVPPGGYSKDPTVAPADGRGLDPGFYPAWNNLYDTTHINWPSLIAGNFLPDYTIPPGPWPVPLSDDYNIGYAPGSVTIPASTGMRGMLVVAGNVTMASGAHWDGIILAGGYFSDAQGGVVHGMVVTGLNQALTPSLPVPADTVPVGAAPGGYHARVQWSWCYAQGAVNSLASLVPMKNAWVDTWSTY
jgi:hypothetical protein